MSYITTDQLAGRLGSTLYARLTDRVNGAVPDHDVAAAIIAGAAAVANGYFAQRYAVPLPLATSPELAFIVTTRVLDLAEYHAWQSSPFVSSPPQRITANYAAAVRWFEDIASGRLPLPAASITAPPAANRTATRHHAPPRTLTAEELSGL